MFTESLWLRRARVVLALTAILSAGSAPAAPAPDDVADSVIRGGDLDRIAAGVDEAAAGDWHWVNAVRLRLKAAGKSEDARRLLDAIAAKFRSDAVLYNLSLSLVDQMPGHNLMRKGVLSSASVRAADEVLARHPGDWLALHIRGLNNLYWPDWFGRAQQAGIDLKLAVEAGRAMSSEHPDQDGPAASYLGLGDALALQDQPAEARAAWAEGVRRFPSYPAFPGRQALKDADLHAAVRAIRDSDKPVDTDLEPLYGVSSPGIRIELAGGTLYGPGPLEDQQLHPGSLNDLRLARPFTGTIPHMNNGTAEPHLPGEIAVGKVLNGLFSDGTQANKNVDVGHVFLMNGKFKLFLAALAGGPNHGDIHMYLDRFWNWVIQDDIGIDPGFAAGVIKFDQFFFSTSPRLLPASTQTQNKEPGGVDRAGSVVSGGIIPGILGDDGESGKLEGLINAVGSFPLDSVFLPGAPFAQTRILKTPIPISPEAAGFLTMANAISHLRASVASEIVESPADRASLEKLFHERMALSLRHFSKAAGWTGALDGEAKVALARLTAAPAPDFDARHAFVCASEADLAVLGTRLGLVRSNNDSSRLADLIKCGGL